MLASEVEVLSESRGLPVPISEKAMVFGEEIQASPEQVDEHLRLRYLDLGRPSVQAHLAGRYRIVKLIREHLDGATPEGPSGYLAWRSRRQTARSLRGLELEGEELVEARVAHGQDGVVGYVVYPDARVRTRLRPS